MTQRTNGKSTLKKLTILSKNIKNFFGEYKQFATVLVGTLVALGLTLAGYRTAANILLAVIAGINALILAWGMIQDLRMGTYGVDILAVTAIVSSVLFKEYWAGIVIVLMLTGGEALEDYAERRAHSELSALLERAPTRAHLLRGRKEVDIAVSQVKTGDKLVIKPGEVVPVDCEVIEGTADVDESSLTGESLPISKKSGNDLLSGSIVLDGALTVKALRSADDSQYSQIIKLVKDADAAKAPFVRMADRYSIPFTLLAFTIALGAWALSGDSLRFLQVLVVATPCPLILGAPIAMISGMSRAAKHGIIIKTGSALEQLATARTFGFDKTGTLTRGQPVVTKTQTYGKLSANEVLSLAAALEQNSVHVLAAAIVNAVQSKSLKIAKCKNIQEVAGKGIEAVVGQKRVLVGRLNFLQDQGVKFPAKFDVKQLDNTAALVAVNGQLEGAIFFEDAIRPEAKATLERLKAAGIADILMVTGDNQTTANKIGKKLGINTIVANALPADKIHAVEQVSAGPVAFVGDGVNDAPVLTASDVGIALGARGSTAASESADVVIMLDDFKQVAVSRDIAKHTIFIAKQSILTGIFLSVILMAIFATGRFKPVYGAAIQEVVDVVVIINALRAHGSWRKKATAG